MNRRSFCLSLAAAGLGSALGSSSAYAQAFPSKIIRIIVPYAPGGGPDVQVRQMAPKFSEAIGQTLIVENKVGAGGVLAGQYVALAAPDGYTVLLGSNTHLLQKLLTPELNFDPLNEFVPVSNITNLATVLVVRADSPYKRAEDLIAALKANPGKFDYGSGGIGTSAHLAGATFIALSASKAMHIPLKGSVEIAASLLRGETEFAFPVASTGVPQVKGGKLRALAVTSRARLPQLPDVPTLNEVMKNDLAIQESWFGMWAPAKTPPDIVKKLFNATVKAIADPTLRQQFEASGGVAAPSESPEAFAAFVRSEYGKWGEIVKLSAAKAE